MLLVVFAFSAFAGQIADVSVKGLPDRDLVIFRADKDMTQPDMVVQKLLPTRLEAVFMNYSTADIDTSALKSGLVNNVQLIPQDDRVVVIIQLDHQGKANPEMFRWSTPRTGICVLEVFHPTSDRSTLSDSVFPSTSAPAASAPAEVEAPSSEDTEIAAVPRIPEPVSRINSITFDKDTNTIIASLSAGVEPVVKQGKFPPSLTVQFPGAALASGVPTFVAKYHERILHITTREVTRASGIVEMSEILIVFTKGPDAKYALDLLDGGTRVEIALTNIEKPKLVEESPVPDEAVSEVPEVAVEPEATIETPVEVIAEVPTVETETPGFEESVVVTPVSGRVLSAVYNPDAQTLDIITDKPSTVTAKRENFPPGYTILVDLAPSDDLPTTIAKFKPGMQWISASGYTVDGSEHTRFVVQFANSVNWTLGSLSDSDDGCGHTIHFNDAMESPSSEISVSAPEEAAVEEAEAPSVEDLFVIPDESAPTDEYLAAGDSSSLSAPTMDEIAGGDTRGSDNETNKEEEYDEFPQYDIEEFSERGGTYILPEMEGMKDQLSDVLVTLPRGISLYSALDIMSQVSGISIILDPYWNQPPTGAGPNNRAPLDTLGPGQGFGGGAGFREAGAFNPITYEQGLAVQGNFVDVPFDVALKLLLDSNNLRKKIYRDESDPYSKPIVFVTSRERIEHELKGANEVELYQLHYADPNQIVQILLNLDILPSVNVGYYTYQGRGSGGYGGGSSGGYGGSGGYGSGGSGSGGSGGGSYRSFDVPGGDIAQSYFAGGPTQGGGGSVGQGGSGGGRSGAGGGAGGGGTGGVGGAGGAGGAIPLATAKSGLIIMRGTRETLELAKDIIRKVDKPPKQASLKVTIYTVTESPQVVYGLVSGSANKDRTFWDYAGGSLSLIVPPKGGIIPADNYTVAFEALQTERKAKVINQTEIAVIDGLPANIEFSRTRGNFRTQVTFDANGNAFRTGTFDEITADTSLDFLPQIDDFGRITLQFSPDVTVFDGPPQVADDGQGGDVTFQPTTTTTLDTVLRLQDGETALIGGLMIETASDDVEKVPILGDLPFIGAIFSHHQKSRETSYIFVTITATIIDDK